MRRPNFFVLGFAAAASVLTLSACSLVVTSPAPVIAGCNNNADCDGLNMRDRFAADRCERWQCDHRNNLNLCRVLPRDNDEDGDPAIDPNCPMTQGQDCDDNDKDIYAAATGGDSGVASPHEEWCDGKDNNCNGVIDEEPTQMTRQPIMSVAIRQANIDRLTTSQISQSNVTALIHAADALGPGSSSEGLATFNGAMSVDSMPHSLAFGIRTSPTSENSTAQDCPRGTGSIASGCSIAEGGVDSAELQFIAGITTAGCGSGMLYIGYYVAGTQGGNVVLRDFEGLSNLYRGVDANGAECGGCTAGGAVRPRVAAFRPASAVAPPQALITYLNTPQTRLVCDAPFVLCGTTCTNTAVDAANCGMCGNACPAGQSCTAGACAAGCPAGTMSCGGACVNTQNDRANCGGCGTACATGQVCTGGTCAASCASGMMLCAGRCVDVNSDAANCGRCNAACAAGVACTAGACACPTGTAHCTAQPQGVAFAECEHRPVDVRMLGAFLMSTPGSDSTRWALGAGNGRSRVLGRSSGTPAAMATFLDRGYFVAYGNESGNVSLHFVPIMANPVLSSRESVDAGLPDAGDDVLVCNTPDAGSFGTGHVIQHEETCTGCDGGSQTVPGVPELPVTIDGNLMTHGSASPATNVAIALSGQNQSNVDIGVTWVEGAPPCGMRATSASVWFSRVRYNGDMHTFTATTPIQVSPMGIGVDSPSITYVDHGFVRPGYARNGMTADRDGGYYVSYVDYSSNQSHVRVRRIAQFDGQLITEPEIDITDPSVTVGAASPRLYTLGNSAEPVNFIYGSFSGATAGVIAGSLQCRPPAQ